MNKLTRANLLAHILVRATVDDIRILYGQAGVTQTLVLIAEGLANISEGDVLSLTSAGRKAYS